MSLRRCRLLSCSQVLAPDEIEVVPDQLGPCCSVWGGLEASSHK